MCIQIPDFVDSDSALAVMLPPFTATASFSVSMVTIMYSKFKVTIYSFQDDCHYFVWSTLNSTILALLMNIKVQFKQKQF